MARSVTWLLAGVLLGALGVGVLFWLWREPVAPSAEAQAALADWLNTSCVVGEGNQKEDALRRFGAELETPLINLFQNGPPRTEITPVEDAARLQLERTRGLINSGAPTGLPPSDVQALRTASIDDWKKRAGEDFAVSRRAAALAGLGIIQGSKGRRLLDKVAADPNSPYKDVARLARLAPANR